MYKNQVTLIGRVVQTPIHKEFGEGKHFAKFSIATHEETEDPAKREAEFHSIVAFGELANLCKAHLRKGKFIQIEGKLRTSRWEDTNGVMHAITDIIATSILILNVKQPFHLANK